MPSRFEKPQHDEARGPRRMPAEIDLAARREPAQSIVFAVLHDECGFGIIIFTGDQLHHPVGRLFRHGAYDRLIAFEHLGRKRINGMLSELSHRGPPRIEPFLHGMSVRRSPIIAPTVRLSLFLPSVFGGKIDDPLPAQRTQTRLQPQKHLLCPSKTTATRMRSFPG